MQLDSMAVYNGLAEAHRILRNARQSLHSEPTAVWKVVSDATDYINEQVRQLILGAS